MNGRNNLQTAMGGFIVILSLLIGTVSSDSTTGVINGIVIDSETGRGIANVIIRLRIGLLTQNTTTDTTGAFSLSDIPEAKDLPLALAHPAYKDTLFHVTVQAGTPSNISIALEYTYIRLTYPNGGEKIFAGSGIPISWVSVGIKKVRLEFSSNSGRNWQVIVPDTDASKGYYLWDVPDIPSTEYLIRITDTADSELCDVSDGFFSNSST